MINEGLTHARDAPILELIRGVLMTLELSDLTPEAILPSSLLIDDLGMDSLKFVDLTVGIEDALGIDVFPMQEWVDDQVARSHPLTVQALADACATILASADRGAT